MDNLSASWLCSEELAPRLSDDASDISEESLAGFSIFCPSQVASGHHANVEEVPAPLLAASSNQRAAHHAKPEESDQPLLVKNMLQWEGMPSEGLETSAEVEASRNGNALKQQSLLTHGQSPEARGRHDGRMLDFVSSDKSPLMECAARVRGSDTGGVPDRESVSGGREGRLEIILNELQEDRQKLKWEVQILQDKCEIYKQDAVQKQCRLHGVITERDTLHASHLKSLSEVALLQCQWEQCQRQVVHLEDHVQAQKTLIAEYQHRHCHTAAQLNALQLENNRLRVQVASFRGRERPAHEGDGFADEHRHPEVAAISDLNPAPKSWRIEQCGAFDWNHRDSLLDTPDSPYEARHSAGASMCVGESSRERFSEGGPLQHIKGSKPSSGESVLSREQGMEDMLKSLYQERTCLEHEVAKSLASTAAQSLVERLRRHKAERRLEELSQVIRRIGHSEELDAGSPSLGLVKSFKSRREM